MSGPDKDAPEKSVQDFLQRWSRRKRGIAEAEDAAASAPAEPPQTGEAQAGPPPEGVDESPPAFDLASLPPIESIDATTDIRAFLAPGVPVELTRAALRRAWTSDPAIRDFVGIAENQWDFTDPDAVPGFGSLEFTEEVRAMVSRLFGDAPQAPDRASVSSEPAGSERPDEVQASMGANRRSTSVPAPEVGAEGAQLPVNQSSDADRAALQNDAAAEGRDFAPRKHGAALPK